MEVINISSIGNLSHHCPYVLASIEEEDYLFDSASDIYEPAAEELSTFLDPEPEDEDNDEDEHVAAPPPPPVGMLRAKATWHNEGHARTSN